jgi:hypothetical protein
MLLKKLEAPIGLTKAVNAMKPILYAPEVQGVRKKRKRGRIDPRRVHLAQQGNPHYRKQKYSREGFCTAVGIVADCSGSMSREIDEVQRAVRALLELLSRTGNPSALWGFTDSVQYGCVEAKGRDAAPNLPAWALRGEGEVTREGTSIHQVGQHGGVTQFKGFTETYRHADDTISAMHRGNLRMGGTPDAPCFATCAGIVSRQQADRKILICLTDGGGYGTASIRGVTRMANALGVETIGLVWGNSSHVEHGDGQYNASATGFHTAEELAESGFFQTLSGQLGKGPTSNRTRWT